MGIKFLHFCTAIHCFSFSSHSCQSHGQSSTLLLLGKGFQSIPPAVFVGPGDAAASVYHRMANDHFHHFIVDRASTLIGPDYLGSSRNSYSAPEGFVSHFREVFGRPAGYSSVREQLYHLRQVKMSISDYALRFRTLTAASGWNEHSLVTTYQQRLNPRLRVHLATYCDNIGLKKFIQLSIQVAHCVQQCIDEMQG